MTLYSVQTLLRLLSRWKTFRALVELDITGLVDAVDVTESGSDGEVGRNGGQSLVDGKDVLGLGVKRVVVDILVVDTILLTSSDTNFLGILSVFFSKLMILKTHHLKPLLHRRGTLKVLGSGLNVEVDFLLTQVNHVAGEERLAVFLEVCLISIEKAIQPWKELLGAVVGVENNRDTVSWSNSSDVLGTSNAASDRGFLLAVRNTLFSYVKTSN